MTNNTYETAMEKGIKNYDAPEHRGMSELLADAAEKLEISLHNVRLAQELLADFYNGGGKP